MDVNAIMIKTALGALGGKKKAIKLLVSKMDLLEPVIMAHITKRQAEILAPGFEFLEYSVVPFKMENGQMRITIWECSSRINKETQLKETTKPHKKYSLKGFIQLLTQNLDDGKEASKG